MSYSLTSTESVTFTVTHAREIASKIATDLKRIQRFYDYPSNSRISNFETEVIALMKAGYLDSVWYGFKRNGRWIEPTLKYTAQDLYSASTNDDPGKIKPGADITNASFHSFLSYNTKWWALTATEKESFECGLPFRRTNGSPSQIDGHLSQDKTYTSGGRSLERATVRNTK